MIAAMLHLPAILLSTYTIAYIQRNYECGSATLSSLTARWVISVPFTPLLADPNNPSNLSYGVISMYPFMGSPSTSGNLTDITLRNIGADPNCATNDLYEVSYEYKLADNLIFGDYASASLTLYNDCSLVGNVESAGPVVANPTPGAPSEDPFLDPCERVDKVWVNPGTGGSAAAALGSYSICSSFPSGFISTTYQQVEWRLMTSGSTHWDDQSSTVYTLPSGGSTPYLFSAYTGFQSLTNMTNGSGTWLVRYRNRESSYGCGSAGAAWVVYVTEVWPL
jgi:hypothetical protein